MDGFQTMGAIRENGTAADIPVIFLTADDDSNTEKRGLEAGAEYSREIARRAGLSGEMQDDDKDYQMREKCE